MWNEPNIFFTSLLDLDNLKQDSVEMMTRFYVICTSKKKEKLITSHSLHNRIHLEQKTKNRAKNKIISSYPILEQLDQ